MESAKIPVAPLFVIASPFVIVDPGSWSGAGPIRNPVHAWQWIPDRVRDDKGGVRDDKGGVRDDKGGVRDDIGQVRDHKGISIFSISLSI